MEHLSRAESGINTFALPFKMTVQEVVKLVIESVEKHGFMSIAGNSPDELFVWAEALDEVEKQTHYGFTIDKVKDGLMVIAYCEKLWNNKEAVAFVKGKIMDSMVKYCRKIHARSEVMTSKN